MSTSFEPNPFRPGLRACGAVEIAGLTVPFPATASKEARSVFMAHLDPAPAEIADDVSALRDHYARQNQRLVDRMLELYAVEITEEQLGGVRVHRVRPAQPDPRQAHRTLVNLHGGAFMWGADSGALVEAIPIAAVMGVEVVTVDYRLAPEHVFPAASEDVARVWAALLERRAPGAMGIYGCSAGALLTAQAVPWIAKAGLPRPGAIALLGGGAGEMVGDSAYAAHLLAGLPPATAAPLGLDEMPYLAGASVDDPLVLPRASPEVLKAFPPTLMITGGRDFAASSVTDLHLRLDELGVDARLYLFDGLWHAFQIFPDLPESQAVYRILSRFFERSLDPAA